MMIDVSIITYKYAIEFDNYAYSIITYKYTMEFDNYAYAINMQWNLTITHTP